MTYQLTATTDLSQASYVTSGRDGSLWCIAANSLYWYDGCAWQIFGTFVGGITDFAVQDVRNMWAIKANDSKIYHFNGVVWALRTVPTTAGTALHLSIGFDGKIWCLDTATKPKVWSFDPTTGWSEFPQQLPSSAPALTQLASGGTAAGDFLVAINSSGREWRWENIGTGWQEIPGVTQGYGRSIAVGPDRTIVLADTMQGQLWKWKSGVDSNWVLLNAQTGFLQVSAPADGRLLAIGPSNRIYSGLKTYPSQKGFRGSDWNNAGTKIFAVRYESGSDKIYRSNDGITFETTPCASLSAAPTGTNGYFWFSIPLMIPTARFGDPAETMLVAPIGLQKIYRCDDLSQSALTFTEVFTDTDDGGTGGVFNGFAEDSDGNVYVGWYAIGSGKNKAILYKATRAQNYSDWTEVESWESRHIHTVRVNPHNGYLYVVLGEPRVLTAQVSDSADTAKVMRSKDGGATWTCVTDTWDTPVMPALIADGSPIYLGLYFATLGFVMNRVVLGEDTDHKRGRIFYFDDDGRDGSDPGSPLPFVPAVSYTTCNIGEFFLGAVSLGDRLYFASQYLKPTPEVFSTRCVSTTDGLDWRVEQICAYSDDSPDHASLGMFTHHPERRGRLIYSLSTTDSFVIDRP